MFGICGGECKAQSCPPAGIGVRGGAGVKAAGGRCGRCAPGMPFVPGLKVVRSGGPQWPQRGRWLRERDYMHGGIPPRGIIFGFI